ncbi:MAG: peptidyl-prolyl cis-trans isomerase [Deltaproteobacteria bacterium]|nr:peptidyl-prolyl cis-trans isomerase [Deltaproteobacteria bacterium]
MKFLTRLQKFPALHFLLIGALLFGIHQAHQSYVLRHSPVVKEELVIGRAQIEQIKQDIFTQTAVRPSTAQVQAAVAKTIDDEILYRQALALHLDRNNPSVRNRLIQLGKFVSQDPKAPDEAHYRKALELGLDRSDLVIKRYLSGVMRLVAAKVPTPQLPATVTKQELQDYLTRNPQAFLTPQQLKISQIYFSRDKRKSQAEADAKTLLKQLRAEGKKPEEIADQGDPFLEGNHFPWLNESSLQRSFGAAFTQHLQNLPAGTWTGPLPSSYGWHLVFIEGIRPPEVPALEQVASQVRNAILKEREQQRLAATLQELRSGYAIRVEDGEVHANGPI